MKFRSGFLSGNLRIVKIFSLAFKTDGIGADWRDTARTHHIQNRVAVDASAQKYARGKIAAQAQFHGIFEQRLEFTEPAFSFETSCLNISRVVDERKVRKL